VVLTSTTGIGTAPMHAPPLDYMAEGEGLRPECSAVWLSHDNVSYG
jgi:hypothetical protein